MFGLYLHVMYDSMTDVITDVGLRDRVCIYMDKHHRHVHQIIPHLGRVYRSGCTKINMVVFDCVSAADMT